MNSKDCVCFLIYFARKFLSDPDVTMAIIKVVDMWSYKYIYILFLNNKSNINLMSILFANKEFNKTCAFN